jgi:hypothetical protein
MEELYTVDDGMLERILGRTRRSRTSPPVGNRAVIWHDAWRGTDRVLRWQGPCLCCLAQTWAFDDGENDPRGVLGDATLWPVDVEFDGEEYEARACALCANDYDSYQAVQAEAVRIGLDAARPYRWTFEE